MINEQRQILVVRDKLYQRPHWKLPGGYVDPGERVRPSAVFFSMSLVSSADYEHFIPLNAILPA